MREVKFRAWDKTNKRWCEFDSLRYSLFSGIRGIEGWRKQQTWQGVNIPSGRWHLDYDRDIELVEWTGLKDRNGKEIYEGDIFRWHGYEVRDGKQIRPIRKREVIWDYRKLAEMQNLIEANQTVEIIGNIYENPELLKGVKT